MRTCCSNSKCDPLFMRYSNKEWDQSVQNYHAATEEFNNKILENGASSQNTDNLDHLLTLDEPQNPLRASEIKRIQEIIERELKNLQEYSAFAREVNRDLESPGCCNPIHKIVWKISLTDAVVSAIRITGVTLAISDDTTATRFIGLGLYALGESLQLVGNTYSNRAHLRIDRFKLVAKINQEQMHDFEQFNRFLQEMWSLQMLEERNENKSHRTQSSESDSSLKVNLPSTEESHSIEENPIFNSPINDDVKFTQQEPPFINKATPVEIHLASSTNELDDRLRSCFLNYMQLSDRFRNDEVYSGLVSYVINQLPENHPLKEGMIALEPSSNDNIHESLKQTEEQPTHIELQELEIENGNLQESGERWSYAKEEQKNEDPLTKSQNNPLTFNSNHDKIKNYLNFMQHYGIIPPKHFNTPNGWTIMQNGLSIRFADQFSSTHS